LNELTKVHKMTRGYPDSVGRRETKNQS